MDAGDLNITPDEVEEELADILMQREDCALAVTETDPEAAAQFFKLSKLFDRVLGIAQGAVRGLRKDNAADEIALLRRRVQSLKVEAAEMRREKRQGNGSSMHTGDSSAREEHLKAELSTLQKDNAMLEETLAGAQEALAKALARAKAAENESSPDSSAGMEGPDGPDINNTDKGRRRSAEAQTLQRGMKIIEQSEHLALLSRVKHGTVAEVEELVSKCPSAASGNSMLKHRGVTPLIAAAQKGRAEVVHALLAAKADPRVKDRWGHSAKDYAVTDGHTEVGEVLQEATLALEALELPEPSPATAEESPLNAAKVMLGCRHKTRPASRKNIEGGTPREGTATEEHQASSGDITPPRSESPPSGGLQDGPTPRATSKSLGSAAVLSAAELAFLKRHGINADVNDALEGSPKLAFLQRHGVTMTPPRAE